MTRPTRQTEVAFDIGKAPLAEGLGAFSFPESLAQPMRPLLDGEPVAISVSMRVPAFLAGQPIGYLPVDPIVFIASDLNVAILYAQITRLIEHGPAEFRKRWPDAIAQATEAVRHDMMQAGDMAAQAEEAVRLFTEDLAGKTPPTGGTAPPHLPSEPCDCTDPRPGPPRPYHCAAFGPAEQRWRAKLVCTGCNGETYTGLVSTTDEETAAVAAIQNTHGCARTILVVRRDPEFGEPGTGGPR